MSMPATAKELCRRLASQRGAPINPKTLRRWRRLLGDRAPTTLDPEAWCQAVATLGLVATVIPADADLVRDAIDPGAAPHDGEQTTIDLAALSPDVVYAADGQTPLSDAQRLTRAKRMGAEADLALRQQQLEAEARRLVSAATIARDLLPALAADFLAEFRELDAALRPALAWMPADRRKPFRDLLAKFQHDARHRLRTATAERWRAYISR